MYNFDNVEKENLYVFEKVTDTVLRCIWFDVDPDTGCKAVTDIKELSFDYDPKRAVKHLYEMMFIGHNGDYKVNVAYHDYDETLEGKARKQSSKEINVITKQLFG